MIDSYRAAMRNYAVFQGRMSRGDYWRFVGVFFAIAFVALIFDHAIGTANKDGGALIGLVYLAHLVPQLAASVRRMHDTDHSGWWLLLSPVALVFALLPGTTGPNRFGPVTAQAGTDRPVGATSAPVGAVVAPAAPPERRDVIAELERLAQLRASGNLTDAEFEVMKAQALAQSRGA